jgi:hypothetical protein
MRSVLVLCVSLLTACSTQAVRCERHLTPINVPRRPVADPFADQSKEVSGERRDATASHGTRRMNAGRPSGEPKGSMPAVAGKGTP